jgi:RNA polymerase sigma-70 factor (ECF subfamily)
VRDRRLHRLFERFRKKGDVTALGKVFDAVAPELYRVAVHLARDLHTAEDLVQSTFVAAIESRERWDAERPLVPWLLGILVRKAAHEQRASARTPEPERLAPRSAIEPARESEASEVRALLQKLLAETSSPYREVLVMHLCEEKSANEIARDLGRAPGTVRVQIHRGLEILRKNMPAGLIATGAFAVLAPRGLAAVRGSVMSAAHSAAAPLAASTASVSGVVLGGLAMKAVSISVAVVGAVVCAVWFALRAPPPTPEVEPVHAQSPDAESARPSSMDTALASAPSPALRTPASMGTQATGTRPTPVAGHATFAVCGRLALPDNSPAAGTAVSLLRSVNDVPTSQSVESDECAGDGSFCLHGAPGTYLVVALRDGLQPWTKNITIDDAPISLDPAILSIGEAIRGRVRMIAEPLPPSCAVSIACRAEGKGLAIGHSNCVWVHGRLLQQPRGMTTDPEGRFTCTGLDRELYRVSLEKTPTARVLHAGIDTEAPNESVDLVVDLARIVLHVRSAGEPMAAELQLVERQLAASTSRPNEIPPVGFGFGSTWGVGEVADAEYLVPAGTACRIEASKDGYELAACNLSNMQAGATIERTLEMKPRKDMGELWIELGTSRPTGFSQAAFGLFATRQNAERSASPDLHLAAHMGPTSRSPEIVRDERTSDGIFRLSGVPANGYDIVAFPGSTWMAGDGYWMHEPVHVEVTAGVVTRLRIEVQAAGRLRVRCDNQRGVHLPARCEVTDSTGTKVATSLFLWDAKRDSFWGGGGSLNVNTPDGAMDVYPNLRPGTYHVRFSLDGYVETTRTVRVELGVTTEVDAVLDDR